MNKEIMKFIASNNGMISAEEAKQNSIDLKRLQRLEMDGELERVALGLYLHKDYIVDPFYLAQYRSSKSVFSHATALYLHRLSDENPSIITMTVPSDWNTQLLKEKDLYKFYYYKEEIWKLGQEEIESPYGHMIMVYDKERTLCDCIVNIDEIGRDIVIKGIKEYMGNKEYRDLYKYAEIFNIKEKVETYVEVLHEI
jgi:predicted transcriptional regulator of viral defense system